MLRDYKAYLLLGLLTSCTFACSEASDLFDGDDARDEGARDDADAPGDGADEAPTGRAEDESDAGTAGRDAATPGYQLPDGDAAAPDAGRDAATSAPVQPDAGAPQPDAGMPAGGVCPQTDGWDAQATAFEDEVLALTNAARAAGHDCDSKGSFGAAGPLKMQNQLRCAARLHSKYMATTGEFSHDQASTGKDVGARLREAGYRASTWGENIAWGQRTPADVVNGWLESDGHCANIMNPSYTELGVGYALGARSGRQAPYWTQNFGRSR